MTLHVCPDIPDILNIPVIPDIPEIPTISETPIIISWSLWFRKYMTLGVCLYPDIRNNADIPYIPLFLKFLTFLIYYHTKLEVLALKLAEL